MSLVDSLLDNSERDTELLVQNDALGDVFSIPRDLDFVLYSAEKQRVETARDFVLDNHYGSATVSAVDDRHRLVVTIRSASTQEVVCSLSALMVCLARLFGLEYDGWGCVIQSRS